MTGKLIPASLGSFTNDELRRLRRNLRKRFRRAMIVEVAFGPGKRKGKRDAKRPFCICFLVSRKRNPRDRKQRIPPTVRCRLKRNSKFVSFEIPTDVVQTRKMKMTGRDARRPNKSSRVTAGSVVSWKEEGLTKRKWAIVTVGHYFPAGSLCNKKVFVYRTSSNKIFGEYMFRSEKSSKLDVAVAEFKKQDLLNAQLIRGGSIPNLKPRTIEQLKNDVSKKGKSLIPPKDSKITISFDYFLPENDEVEELWTIKNVIRVNATANGAFKGGRSGTIFVANNGQIALVQYAGTTGSAKQGLGQAYVSIMDWLLEQLKTRVHLVAGSLRLVSKF